MSMSYRIEKDTASDSRGNRHPQASKLPRSASPGHRNPDRVAARATRRAKQHHPPRPHLDAFLDDSRRYCLRNLPGHIAQVPSWPVRLHLSPRLHLLLRRFTHLLVPFCADLLRRPLRKFRNRCFRRITIPRVLVRHATFSRFSLSVDNGSGRRAAMRQPFLMRGPSARGGCESWRILRFHFASQARLTAASICLILCFDCLREFIPRRH